ncbi:MAG: tetratricopeptide repeat protein [Melioribacteraceae bacterium]|nr:tetratricopeptide repeat protein [Melioribacteraceae bacterium]
MKRVLIILSIVSMGLGFSAFQCASAELTGAKLYINQKQYDKAKESLLKEVEKNPSSDEGYYLLGFLYGEEGSIMKMLEMYDKSLSISKKYAQGIIDSKKYYWATGFNRGVSYFNSATKASTPDSQTVFFDKAVRQFDGAIACQPDSAATYINLAYAYLNMQKPDSAVAPLETSLKKGKTPDVYTMLGELYMNKGNKLMVDYKASQNVTDSTDALKLFDKSVTLLEEGRKNFPDDSEILLRLSNAYIAANKLDVAMDAFKAGIDKDPENKYYRYNYGVLLLNAKDFSGAETQFAKAVELDPEYTNAIYNLAVTYVRWGTQVREAAEAEGKEDEAYKEKFELALPHMEKYLEANPKEPAVWELLGKIYANLGKADKSREAFQKADQYR